MWILLILCQMPPKLNNEIEVALIKQALLDIKAQVTKMDTKLDSNFVTKEEFGPVKNIVYGMVAVILLAVIAALVALIIIPR